MILECIAEAVSAGAREFMACREIGIDRRTPQRWRARDVGDDMRHGPKTQPGNKLDSSERRKVLAVANSPEFRDMSPKQIVPCLADRNEYVASESTFYRVLHDEDQMNCRGPTKPRNSKRPTEYRAVRPNQVWSWDITYLRGPIRGQFFYLYLMIDVWSRDIVGWEVHETENDELSSALLVAAATNEEISLEGVVLHQDNGSPMKGATFKATMERLGVIPSYSRPRVSDDNPYSESLFRTLKCCPAYPKEAFASIEAARSWVEEFVNWYRFEHLHSGIGFVTPNDRHQGRDKAILEARRQVYEAARAKHPDRWNGRAVRDCRQVREVVLNPAKIRPATETLAPTKGDAPKARARGGEVPAGRGHSRRTRTHRTATPLAPVPSTASSQHDGQHHEAQRGL